MSRKLGTGKGGGKSAADFQQEFAELIRFVGDADAKVRAGTVVDMGDLDRKVSALCAGVQNAPPETVQQVQDSMAALITGLDTLAQSLSEYQQNAAKGKGK